MAYSIYDVDYSQNIGKPSDLLKEDDYTNDVFVQTRPEVFDFDKRDTGDGVDLSNPYYKYYPEDNSVKEKELSDQKYNYTPQNWNSQDAYTTDLLFKNRKNSQIEDIISRYRMEHNPVELEINIPLKNKTAATFENLMRQVFKFPKVKEKATKTTAKLISADEKNLIWKYRVKGHEPYSDKRGHVVTVHIIRDNHEKDLRKMKVNLVCTCPFWKYKGPDFNSHRFNYLEGPQKSNGQAPVVNPSQAKRTLICKHVYAVGLLFQRFAAKHNLDTFKEIDEIFNLLNNEKQSLLPNIGMESIEEIANMLSRTDKIKIDQLIGKYKQEKDKEKKKKIHDKAIETLGEILEYQDKGLLQKILKNVKDYTKKLFNKFKIKKSRKASVDNVISMYIHQRNRD